jgi:hypothetical protein
METFGDVLDHLRQEILRDTETPYLWSDESLCEFIAQANDEFAEAVQHIRDSTSIATEVALEAGIDTYTLNAVVLAVMSAKIVGNDTDLIRAGSPALNGFVPSPETVQWLEQINYGTAKDGTPLVFTTDDSVESGGAATIRFWPVPALEDAGKVVKLRLIRLPLVPCAMDTLDTRPEMQRQYVPALCHGAAARAYNSQDADGGDVSRADKQAKIFEAYIKRASTGMRRKLFQPASWGFGRGGFTHSR